MQTCGPAENFQVKSRPSAEESKHAMQVGAPLRGVLRFCYSHPKWLLTSLPLLSHAIQHDMHHNMVVPWDGLQDQEEICWICLDETSAGDGHNGQLLISPCKCPRKVHPTCMARSEVCSKICFRHARSPLSLSTLREHDKAFNFETSSNTALGDWCACPVCTPTAPSLKNVSFQLVFHEAV